MSGLPTRINFAARLRSIGSELAGSWLLIATASRRLSVVVQAQHAGVISVPNWSLAPLLNLVPAEGRIVQSLHIANADEPLAMRSNTT